jgi:hypothetical protein
MQTKHLKRVLKENKNGRIEILIILIKSLQGKVLHDFALGDIAFEWPELKSLGYIVSFRTEKGKTTKASF